MDSASFPANIVVKHVSAKNMCHSASLYTIRQFPTPTYMQVGDKAKGSLESIYIQSNSASIDPIEGQKLDLPER